MFKDTLQIIVITCNRKKYVNRTLQQLLESPLNSCNVTVIDNNSDDGTYKELKELYSNYRNIKIIKNKYNIGGNANIVEAFKSCNKSIKYTWILCDDDIISATEGAVTELKQTMGDDYDIIVAANYLVNGTYNYGQLFRQFSFVPSTIFKTELITSDVISCMYDNVYSMLPHLALYCVALNMNKSIKVLEHNFVSRGQDFSTPSEYTRTRNFCSPYRENMSWFVGYCSSIQLIKNERLKQDILNESLRNVGCGSVFKGIVFELNLNDNYYKSCMKNITDIFAAFDNYKRFLLLLILLFSFIRRRYNIKNTVEGFIQYYKNKNTYRTLNKILKKYKDKKILLYGAGTSAIALLQIDKSSILYNNIDYVADIKFPRGKESKWEEFMGINPMDIIKYDFDLILVTAYRFDIIKNAIKQNRISIKTIPLNKVSLFEKLFGTQV